MPNAQSASVAKPEAAPPQSGESGPLKEVFEEFRAELGEMGAEEEDLETHYNLGIAFREMGLLEEAISEFQKVAKANERGRAPTVNQLAEYLELDLEEIIDALQAIQAYEALSLDAPRPGADDEVVAYGDSIGREDERFELVELDATITAVLEHIPPRERLILRMRFVEDLTQTEIAAQVGISQMQVSRLLRRSLDQLRALTQEANGPR